MNYFHSSCNDVLGMLDTGSTKRKKKEPSTSSAESLMPMDWSWGRSPKSEICRLHSWRDLGDKVSNCSTVHCLDIKAKAKQVVSYYFVTTNQTKKLLLLEVYEAILKVLSLESHFVVSVYLFPPLLRGQIFHLLAEWRDQKTNCRVMFWNRKITCPPFATFLPYGSGWPGPW